MKNIRMITAILCVVWFAAAVLMGSSTTKTDEGNKVEASYNDISLENTRVNDTSIENLRTNDLRGIWVASVANIDYPSKPTTSDDVLKSEALKILDYSKEMGMNAVFLQVRPAADALYKSKYFPWSKYLTGKQGTEPLNGFDPLEFWVNEAHKRGIQLHAWINPYRVSKNTNKDKKHDFSSLYASNPARIHPEYVVKHSDGNLYFDPGIPEVRALIVDSVKEIVSNYEVDGIHMDDYFYPDTIFNDSKTYKKYAGGFKNINDWRRENVNILIRELSKGIKSVDDKVKFGISPFGIWANKKTNPLGSDTSGGESYNNHYADTRKWVKEHMIDYIVPQLYWNIGFSIADYSKLLSWWDSTVAGTGVDLYIGQAAYRTGVSDPSSPWYGINEIEKQLKLNNKMSQVKGSIFFSYKSFVDNQALGASVKAHYEKRDGSVVKIPVLIGRPDNNITTGLNEFYLTGSSDPQKPLYINGEIIKNRSEKGYFGVLMPLREGINTFIVSQEGSFDTCVINKTKNNNIIKMNTIEIEKSSTFPLSQEYRLSGEKIMLSCRAPIGRDVYVKINGKSYKMSPEVKSTNQSGIFGTIYTYNYTIPTYKGTAKIIDLGAPQYSFKYNGKTKTRSAKAKIGVILKDYPMYAKVTKDVINTFDGPLPSDRTTFELYKGMIDYVTGMTGNFVRTSSGQWLKKDSVYVFKKKIQLKADIKKVEYIRGEKCDVLRYYMSSPSAANVSFDGTSFKMNISAVSKAVSPELPEDSIVSSVKLLRTYSGVEYLLGLAENKSIDGYYIKKISTGLELYIKREVKSQNEETPLEGIKILIDPGHGGSELGTTGPLGFKYPEKTINLKLSLKLQAELKNLGAEVFMTRTTDKAVSLEERLSQSRNLKPDLFISMHANSMKDNVDISKVSGFAVFYRQAFSEKISNTILLGVINNLERENKGVNECNFYVTRGTWTQSILIESGFVPNPNEFEWLVDEEEQSYLAKNLADSIRNYYMD